MFELTSSIPQLTSVSPMIGSGGAIGKCAQCESEAVSTAASAKPRLGDVDDDGDEPQIQMSRFI